MHVIFLDLFFHTSSFGNAINLPRTDPAALIFCRFIQRRKDLSVRPVCLECQTIVVVCRSKLLVELSPYIDN